MANVVVTKGEDGKLVGLGDKGGRAWRRFLAMVDRLEIGATLQFSYWEPRAPGHHRAFFRMLNALFERQEQFIDVDHLRAWVTVGAGEAEFMPGPAGRMVAFPKSIAWHKLDEAEFTELARKVQDFLWTEPAQRWLWPHLSAEEAYQMVDTMHLELNQRG